MRFKIDENLPVEAAEILQQAGHAVETVHSEKVTGVSDQKLSEICQRENRILLTLDIGFANIRTYPPEDFPGLVVIRSKRQDKPHILRILNKIIATFNREEITGKLWIVEENRIRIRS
jgi:predicted nuclease of predicted toxin-antitoxin system